MSLVTIEINGKPVETPQGATILQAAKSAGIPIPTLCDDERLEPYGACRMCMVEIQKRGRTRLVASCLYPVEEGLTVQTETDRVARIRKMLIEVMWPAGQRYARQYGVTHSRFTPGMADCSLCGLCVRNCAEVKKANVLYFKGRSIDRKPALVEGSSLPCSTCSECFSLCTGGWVVASRA
jgi:bidirectional [NiFe] hydrogenase diaphorase subunit